ncbi:unnamed protein product [Allacma fusca]|uniref:Uncharacterized protein n=1 Tax=Allacma fusca TaxID=39272 RepID=A0A8J2PP70_9HEXA|nr:unnamed protein product [Allacma fusca]
MERKESIDKHKDTEIQYQDIVQVFRHQVFERLLDEGRRKGDVNGNCCRRTCEKVWSKFSETHQKSPSHKNNNVQNCSHRRRTRAAVRKDGGSTVTERERGDGLRKRVATLLLALFLRIVKIWVCLVFVLTALYCLIVLHKPTELFLTRYSQDVIYPMMRFLRLISLPYVKSNPSSTKIYGDPCLIRNPFFAVYVDCWPCESSKSIIDLTGFSNFSAVFQGTANPFIVKDAFNKDVGFEDIRAISYEDDEFSKQLFVASEISDYARFKSVFERDPASALSKETLHASWEINRASSVRMLRKYFPKPYFVPNSSEVSMQHFLFVDQILSPTYTLPVTEFANVFLTQASGTRHIILFPADTCKMLCKPLSVLLHPKDVLFYSWLFWRPKSRPVDSHNLDSNLSITYMGSFY